MIEKTIRIMYHPKKDACKITSSAKIQDKMLKNGWITIAYLKGELSKVRLMVREKR